VSGPGPEDGEERTTAPLISALECSTAFLKARRMASSGAVGLSWETMVEKGFVQLIWG